jgi:hypothetical protein
VVKFLNSETRADVKLVSFISLRNFFKNRRKIKSELSDAIVLPMFPGFHRWKKNLLLLHLVSIIKKPSAIIGRSVLATQLALSIKRKQKTNLVIYDGRGAISAEWKEYNVVDHPKMVDDIYELEKEVVIKSDFRVAVSEQLIKFWRKEFNYQSKDHVAIPCTLNKVFENLVLSEETIKKSREQIGIKNEDLLFVYSGSVAGWQSFDILYKFVSGILDSDRKVKLLFLSDVDPNIIKLQDEFKERVICKKVKPIEVPFYLQAADYGLLIREESLTNLVASPVKFAEYLACGLAVIISENLGDYSAFVLHNKCGYTPRTFVLNSFDKQYLRNLSLINFTKKKHIESYRHMVNIAYKI